MRIYAPVFQLIEFLERGNASPLNPNGAFVDDTGYAFTTAVVVNSIIMITYQVTMTVGAGVEDLRLRFVASGGPNINWAGGQSAIEHVLLQQPNAGVPRFTGTIMGRVTVSGALTITPGVNATAPGATVAAGGAHYTFFHFARF